MRAPHVVWALAAATTSCAIVANLGDRTLGDPFGTEDGGVDGAGSDGNSDVVSPFDAPPGCVVDNFPAPSVEAQIYVAIDTSASMMQPLPTGGTRLSNERDAVIAFVHEPLSAPLYATVGLHPGDADGGCDPGPYAAPSVPLGQLGTGTADAIAGRLNQVLTANGSSPWSAMLAGAHQRLAAAQQQNPGRVTALAFIADSTPTACALLTPQLTAIVGPPAQARPPIRTFTIPITEVPSDITQYFDPIAKAGGTDAGFDTVPPSKASMVAALEAIRDEVACDLKLPVVGASVADLSKGLLFIRAGGADVTLARVADGATCATADAYYPGATSDRVHLCPKACARLLGDSSAKAYVATCRP
jgi:hypothetical protein